MDPAVVTGQVRVKVVGDQGAADIALPTSLPIRELIAPIRKTLASGRDDEAVTDVDAVHDGLRPYSLAPPGATPFSLDATLGALAVDDGELLLLRQLPPGPAAPPVVEDIADASAIHSASQFTAFSHAMLAGAVQVVVLSLGALVCGLALTAWYGHHRGWAVIALAVLAVAYAAATAVLGRRGHAAASARMGVATTVPLTLALFGSLPGDGAAPRVFLAAAGLVAWSLLLLTLTRGWVSTHTTIVTVAAPVAVVAALRILAHLPYLTLGSALIAISLVAALQAPFAAAVWARYPLPNVAAPDEEPPAPLGLAEIEDLPRKTAVAHAFQSGLIASSVLLAAIGSVLVLWLPDTPSLLAWWLVIAAAIVTVLRLRYWVSAVPAMWFLAAPFLTATALSAAFAFTGHLLAASCAAAALAALTALLLLGAAVKPRDLTIPQRRYLDIFQYIVLATIPPTVVVLIGLVSLIRNRGAL